MEANLRIESVVFKRTENSEWEVGIIINEGTGLLLDYAGKPVDECWNWKRDNRHVMTIENSNPFNVEQK